MAYAPLRIKAEEDEDLEVISACLQDAIIPLAGLDFDKDSNRFHLLANRFCWECEREEAASRVLSMLHFHHVTDVHKRSLDRTNSEELLNLLTIHRLGQENWIHLVFSGGSEVRLKVDQLTCHLCDIEEPHPTVHVPSHASDQ